MKEYLENENVKEETSVVFSLVENLEDWTMIEESWDIMKLKEKLGLNS